MHPRRSAPRARRAIVLLAAAASIASCGDHDARAASPMAGESQVVEHGGIRIACRVEPLRTADPNPAAPLRGGDLVRVTFQATDTATGRGLDGLQLGAWLAARPAEIGDKTPDEATTRNVIRKLVSSSFGSGATNLNTWYLLALENDNTLAVIDPTVDFSRTRLRNLVELPARGADLAFDGDGERLFVTMPERGECAIVDLRAMTLATTLAVGKQPHRIHRQKATGLLWIEDDGSDAIHVVDPATTQCVRTIAVGGGDKAIAFADDRLATFAAATASGRVVAIDGSEFAAKPLADLGAPITGLAYATAAEALQVVLASGRLVAIHKDGRVRDVATLPAGSGPLVVAPDGRWLFAIDRDHDTVRVIDTATNAIAHTIATDHLPTQIVCSPRFAHVYCAGSRELTLIQLSALADAGNGPTLHIPVLQSEPKTPIGRDAAAMIAVTPEGDSVLVGAPEEKLVYYYTEGTNAPMGSYQNYGRTPVALGVLDRSLRGLGNGIYSTTTTLDQSGNVDVYLYLDRPTQVFGRFPLRVEPDAETIARAARMKPLAIPELDAMSTNLPVGKATALRFSLRDLTTNQPVAGKDDVRVLAHTRVGNWQQRLPAVALPDGRYEVVLTIPQKGAYRLQVQSQSLNLGFASHRPLEFAASDDVEAPLPIPAVKTPTVKTEVGR